MTDETAAEKRVRKFLEYMRSRAQLLKHSPGFLERIDAEWKKAFEEEKNANHEH